MNAARVAVVGVILAAAMNHGLAAAPPEPVVLKGHTKAVTAVAWGADGKAEVTAARPDQVGRVAGPAFHPDGRRVATLDVEGVRVWDGETGRELYQINQRAVANRGAAVALAFSRDGKRLVTAYNFFLAVYDAADGKEIKSTGPLASKAIHPPLIYGAGFGSDGQRLLVAGRSLQKDDVGSPLRDDPMKVWDAETREELYRMGRMDGKRFLYDQVVFSTDGKYLAGRISGGYSDTTFLPARVYLWDTGSGKLLHTLRGEDAAADLKEIVMTSMTLSGDGKRIALGCEKGEILLWEWPGKWRSPVLRGHRGKVQTLAFAPGGKRLASAGDDHIVRVWNVPSGTEEGTFRGHTRPVYRLAFSRDGRCLFSAAEDLRRWDLTASP